MKKTKLFNGSIIALLVAMLLTTSLAVAQTTDDGLNVTKTVTPDTNVPFQYNVTLEAWSTGDVSTTQVYLSKATDIVIVFDSSTGNDTQYNAMVSDINSFIDFVKADATNSNVTHRLAIVQYNDNAYPGNFYSSSGYYDYIHSNENQYLMESSTSGYTSVVKLFNDISSSTDLTTLKSAIGVSRSSSESSVQCGVELARLLLTEPKNKQSDNAMFKNGNAKLVVVFSHNTPSSKTGMASTTMFTIADEAFTSAKKLKDASTSIFVDDRSGSSGNELKTFQGISSDYLTPSVNLYMGGSITLGTAASNYHYSTSIENIEANAVFEKGSTPTTTYSNAPYYSFTGQSKVSDMILSSWSAPSVSSVTVMKAPWNGTAYGNEESAGLSASVTGNTVSVSDFDFTANYVGNHVSGSSTAGGGYKLIVTYPIKLNVAGLTSTSTSVPVNEANAGGLYDGSTLQQGFSATSVPLYTIEISRTGLNIGESATFTVSKVNGSDETVVGQVVTTCTTKDVAATATLKVPEAGTYRVRETTWGFTYSQSNYNELNCNAAGKFSCSFSGKALSNDALHSEAHKTY